MFKSPLTNRPFLTAILVFHNMQREAWRTLASLNHKYQRDMQAGAYRITVLDHGSDQQLDARRVEALADNISYHYIDTKSPSPVAAINAAVARARTPYVLVNIDGARILSPGVLAGIQRAARLFRDPFVYTLGWHLGPDIQNNSQEQGYNQTREDQLLAESDWQSDGYRLFDISVLAGSSVGGFLSPIAESNCFAMPRKTWQALGGFDPRFVSAGGGLANFDLFERACERPGSTPVCLLGEGTFHQIHGGVATNAPAKNHPWARFKAEYEAIKGHEWQQDETLSPFYMGQLPKQARRFVWTDEASKSTRE